MRPTLNMTLDELYHHVVLQHILTVLPEHAHTTFVSRLHANPADHALLVLLRTYEPKIEEQLSAVTLSSTQKFIDAIHA